MKRGSSVKPLISVTDCFSLAGKNIVVFGGGGKMAESFSRTFLEAGCRKLILVDTDSHRLFMIQDSLAKRFPGSSVEIFQADVTQKTAAKKIASFLRTKIRLIDICVYAVMNKPPHYYAPCEDYSQKTWDTALSGNLSGAFFLVQKLLNYFANSSSIIFISSIYGIIAPDLRIYKGIRGNIYGGKYPLTVPPVYSASKSGLIGLGKYLAVLLSERNIRVNILVPGGVYDGQSHKFYKRYADRVPLRRMAHWSDYNGPMLFLASDASRYMTGQLLIVDGGLSVW